MNGNDDLLSLAFGILFHTGRTFPHSKNILTIRTVYSDWQFTNAMQIRCTAVAWIQYSQAKYGDQL